MHSGFWDKATHKSIELEGRTIGLIDLGAIGLRVAKMADALGMRVLGYDPYASQLPAFVTPADLPTIWRESDVLSLHCPLTNENRNLLNAETLSACKKGVIVVNTARGGLTDGQRAWLTTRIEADGGKKTAIGHLSVWQLLCNKHFLVMAIVCAGASSTGTALSIWQPQILKGFGLSIMQAGLVNLIPYGIAWVAMVLWCRHSDRTGERRWHTAPKSYFSSLMRFSQSARPR